MENLYYSKAEKRLFYIAGYVDSSKNVKDIIGTMNNIRNFFIKQCRLKDNALVKTDFITQSTRYNRMRYFWIDDCETPPEEAYVLNEDWTMHKWISN